MLTVETRPSKEKLILTSMTAPKFYRETISIKTVNSGREKKRPATKADKTKLRFKF